MVCSEYSWLRGHRSVLCTSLLQSIAYLRQSPFAVAFPSKSPSVLWENPQDSSPAPQFQVLYWFANIKKLQTLWSAVNILGCGDIVRCSAPLSYSRLPTSGNLLSLSHFPANHLRFFGKIRRTLHLLRRSKSFIGLQT